MISPEKREANRNNARKSTGPKSPEGKARSARNATTHGITAQPGEPTEAYRETLAEWVGDLKPRGIVERTLVERACRAAWNLRRCDRHEDATSAKRTRDAAEWYELAEAARVEAVGRRLIAMPEADGPATASAGYARPGDEDPEALLAELRRTAAGVDWLLARWAELGRDLKQPGGWDESRRFIAVRLLGLRPEAADDLPGLARVMPLPGGPASGGSWFDHPALKGSLEAAVEAEDQGLGSTKEIWFNCIRAVAARERGEAESESESETSKKARGAGPRRAGEAGAADAAGLEGEGRRRSRRGGGPGHVRRVEIAVTLPSLCNGRKPRPASVDR